jgi:multidrug resistance efflux pump
MAEQPHASTAARPSSQPETNGNGAVNGQKSLSERVRSLRLQGGGSAKPRSAWLPWGLTGIAFAMAILFAWRAYRLSPSDVAAASDSSSAASTDSKPVDAAPAATASETTAGDVVLDAKGYVIAAHQIQLSPQVGGEIIWLDPNFKEGAVYRKGDRLAEVDPVIYKAQLKDAEAKLRVAQVNLQQVETGSTLKEITAAKAQLRNMAARLEFSRIDERNKRAARDATSRDDMDKAVVQSQMDQAAHAAQKETLDKLETSLQEQRSVCRAQLISAQAAVEQAAKQLRNCTIVAPTTGIILSKKAELGGYVNPFAFGAAGYLCEMADLRDLEVELDIQERDISRVHQGQHCRIMPEAGQNDNDFLKSHPQGYGGIVSRRLPMANRSKGAITVRVKVEIPEHERSGEYLLPDMGVLVSFLKQGSK